VNFGINSFRNFRSI